MYFRSEIHRNRKRILEIIYLIQKYKLFLNNMYSYIEKDSYMDLNNFITTTD